MAHEMLPQLSYAVVLGTVAASFSMVPEACDPLIQSAARSWSKLSLVVRLIRERFQSRRRSSFWEIDMTKFEP